MHNCMIIAGSLRNDFGTTIFIVCFSSSNPLSCQRWPQVGGSPLSCNTLDTALWHCCIIYYIYLSSRAEGDTTRT